jgi:hypothetical protein
MVQGSLGTKSPVAWPPTAVQLPVGVARKLPLMAMFGFEQTVIVADSDVFAPVQLGPLKMLTVPPHVTPVGAPQLQAVQPRVSVAPL